MTIIGVSTGLLVGALLTLCVSWLWLRSRWWYQYTQHLSKLKGASQWDYLGHEMTTMLQDRASITKLLTEDIPKSLSIKQSCVLFKHERRLIESNSSNSNGLELPLTHAGVRYTAAQGKATKVQRRLATLLKQYSDDLDWTSVWVPIMRGAELEGVWLIGHRTDKGRLGYSVSDLQWFTMLARQVAVSLLTITQAEREHQISATIQTLYHQALNAGEAERKRLSREIHDGVLQDLCAIVRDLKSLGHTEEHAGFDSLITRSSELTKTTRAICNDLRPPFVAENLTVALSSLVERMNAVSDVPVSIDYTIQDVKLTEEKILAVYRIVQESINNAIKHADASAIAVRITQYENQIRITIQDDGVGLPKQGSSLHVKDGHIGLASMRERAAMIHAKFDIQSVPDYGTIVIVELNAL